MHTSYQYYWINKLSPPDVETELQHGIQPKFQNAPCQFAVIAKYSNRFLIVGRPGTSGIQYDTAWSQ